MIKAYLDEGGTHRGSPILCVAGFSGTPNEWKLFEKDWQPHLNGAGISDFHAVNPACDKLRSALLRAISDNNLRGILVSIEPEIYKRHAGEQYKTVLGNPYAVCAVQCAMDICMHAQENNLGPVSLFYEMGQPNTDHVYKILTVLSEESPELGLQEISFIKKDVSIAMHTADFLSHVAASMNDYYWIEQFDKETKIRFKHIGSEQFQSVSKTVATLLSQERTLRRNLKKKFKYDNESVE